MNIHCFTSISFSYLNRARVLGSTLKQHHPDWVIWLLLTDKVPEGFVFQPENEPWDNIIYVTELGIPNIDSWLFKHDVIEACTAVKGPFLKYLINEGADKIFYLDPDVAVINSMQPMVDMLESSSILLTPHQLEPDDEIQSVWDNEICSLIHGVYNLGFIAINNDVTGRSCAEWWSDRCLRFCYDEKHKGLFVDQKWCDLIPAFFGRTLIVQDPGYNVASWNLNRRKISVTSKGDFVVNHQYPLRFFHFTKLGPIGDVMTKRYAGDNLEVYELWAWYKRMISESTDARIPDKYWFYANYSSGHFIPKSARELYRHRIDLQENFPDPFDSSDGGYEAWWNEENAQGKLG